VVEPFDTEAETAQFLTVPLRLRRITGSGSSESGATPIPHRAIVEFVDKVTSDVGRPAVSPRGASS
jgi:hypothetical protein